MPYQSEKQRRFMHAKHPGIAARWDKTYGGKVAKASSYGSVASGRRIVDDELDEFGKGVLRQGVARPIARRSGGTARRFVTGDQNSSRIVGKSVQSSLGSIGQYRATGTNAVRRKVAGDEPKGELARRLAQRRVTAVGKADLEDVEKFSFGGLRTGVKNTYGVARGGFRSGLAQSRGATGAAAKPKMGLGASVAASKSPALQRVGSFAQTAGRNPLATGAVAGAGVGGAGAASMGGGRRRESMYAPPTPMYGFGKRTADPEDDRRFRQGAYAAGAGIGGAAMTASGVRGIRRDSRSLSRIKADADLLDTPRVQDPPRRAQQRRHPKGATDPATGKPLRGFRPFTPAEVDAENRRVNRINQARAHQREQLDAVGRLRQGAKGKIVSGRSAGKLAGGAALLGTSGVLLHRRHEDRWD